MIDDCSPQQLVPRNVKISPEKCRKREIDQQLASEDNFIMIHC